MRGGPADLLASRELMEASPGLRFLYLELRPHKDMRCGPLVGDATEGEVLTAMAFGVKAHLRPKEAASMAEEGKRLGLFRVEERPRDGGAPGELEWVLAVVPLPPTVHKARYADRRGPRGGKSDAERSREYRDNPNRKKPGGGEGGSQGGGDPGANGGPPKPPGGSQKSAEVPSAAPGEVAVLGRLEASPGTPRVDLGPGERVAAGTSATSPVTDSNRDASRPGPVTTPPPNRDANRDEIRDGSSSSLSSESPSLSGASLGSPEREREGDPDAREKELPPRTATEIAAMGNHDCGAFAVALLGEGTADVFTTLADADSVTELGRCVKRLSLDETLLLTITAHWRTEPTTARAAFKWAKSVREGAEKVSLGLLLGKRLPSGFHKGTGLQAALHAAQSWLERYRKRERVKVVFRRRPGPARAGLPPHPLGQSVTPRV